MRNLTLVTAVTLTAAFGVLPSTSQAADGQKNITGLPGYPNDDGGTMDSVSRSIPNGQHCIHYSGSTQDALDKVEDWYKKALPNARTDDVNKDSLYGSYFKLDGIKLLVGNDIVNIYRMANSKKTTIEIFKCSDAVQPKR
jgi:hypothetical protein